ncbi:MAG: hypothetical protein U5L72_12145 [Bacteroidales bacterium]|nr:hypothetical protein [Bacteroidales bacterium]
MTRKNRNLEKKAAQCTGSNIVFTDTENIDYNADRNLDREQLLRFAECGFISKH